MVDAQEAPVTATTPALTLTQKLGKQKVNLRDVFTPERIQACEAEISHVHEAFLQKAGERLAEMHQTHQRGTWDKASRETLISHAFSLKGQGESLGYTLMARVADSLCCYCEKLASPSSEQRVVMSKHLQTMQAILDTNIKGEGGTIGRALIQEMQKMVQKFPAV